MGCRAATGVSRRSGNTVRGMGTSLHVDPSRTTRRTWAWARLITLAAFLLVVFVVEQVRGWDDVRLVRQQVDAAGPWGAAVFVAGYAVLCLLPAPKGLLTALGGALFGLWLGALLSWVAALSGAAAAFGLGRGLGRDAVQRLTRGRGDRVDRLLADHGFASVVALRLVPVLPYTVINYSAGLTGVSWRAYLAGSALGMVPGSLAYAALGAWGADPWGIFAGVAALVVLVLVGGVVGRRLLGPHDDDGVRAPSPSPSPSPPPHGETPRCLTPCCAGASTVPSLWRPATSTGRGSPRTGSPWRASRWVW